MFVFVRGFLYIRILLDILPRNAAEEMANSNLDIL